MTKFQKAVSVCMSLCFFVILAVLPGQFFFGKMCTGSCLCTVFWKKGCVCASCAGSGNIRKNCFSKRCVSGGKNPAGTAQGETAREESKMSLPEERGLKQRCFRTLLSICRRKNLRSRELSFKSVFCGRCGNRGFSGAFKCSPFSRKKNGYKSRMLLAPQILIYHSHASEAFADSREGVQGDTIVGVGSRLAQILKEKYGYHVIHIKEAFDMAGGALDRSKAYDYAGEFLTSFLEKNLSIEVILDVHRDGVPEERRLVTEINGKKTAQVMFYNGISYTKKQGKVHYLPNPYIEDNLAFSFQMEYQAAQYYPDFYPMHLSGGIQV